MSTVTTEAIRKTVLVDFTPGGGVRPLHAAASRPGGRRRTHSYGGDKVKDVVFEPVRRRLGSTRSPTRANRTGAGSRAWEPPNGLLLEWLIGEAPAPRSR